MSNNSAWLAYFIDKVAYLLNYKAGRLKTIAVVKAPKIIHFYKQGNFIMKFQYLSIQAIALAFTSSVFAADSDDYMAVGVSAFYNKLPYQAWDGDEVTPIPYFAYKKGNFYVEGADVGYTMFAQEQRNSGYYFDVIGSTRVGFGYESDDSPALAGMEDRDDIAVETGLKAGYYNEFGLFELSARQDIAGAHKGFVANVSYFLPLGDEAQTYQFIPYVGASYQSDKFNNYYYGVMRNEATASRQAYNADGGTNLYLGATLVYNFTPQWSLSLNAQYETLASSIEDSPIVTEDNMVSGFMGVTYTF